MSDLREHHLVGDIRATDEGMGILCQVIESVRVVRVCPVQHIGVNVIHTAGKKRIRKQWGLDLGLRNFMSKSWRE
jgi:hypothetical protein